MKKAKLLTALALCFVLALSVFSFVACNMRDLEGETVTVVDQVGDTVELPKNPQRIGVFARSAADKLIAFGLGDRMTGVFETLPDNPWAATFFPEIMNMYRYSYRTTTETYLEHRVDMIFAPERHLSVAFREAGIPAVTVSQFGNPRFDEFVFHFSDMVTQIFDCENVVARVAKWQGEFNAVRNEIEEALTDVQVTQTFHFTRGDRNRGVAHTENGSASMHNFIGRILRVSYVGYNAPTNQFTPEALLEADPDFIFVGGAFAQTIIAETRADVVWENLSAVQNDRIHPIGLGFAAFEQKGVGLTLYLARLANIIYPEKFNFDLETMLIDLAYNYYGVTITPAIAQNMLNARNAAGQPLA